MNFLSTGNVFTEIQLDRHPTTLVVGANGAGKTTFIDAITFALFGKAFRNINKPMLPNSINQTNCVVEIEFDIGSKSYKIIRGIKPNIFEIYCDGVQKDQDSRTKDDQKYLEEDVLKLNFKTFKQIVVLGSNSFVPFMVLPAADRRAISEDILDIQIYSHMSKIAKKRISTNDEEIKDVDKEIKVLNDKIQLQRNNIESNTKRSKDKIVQNQVEISSCNDKIYNTNISIENIKEEIEQLRINVVDLTDLKDKKNQLSKFESKIENKINILKKEHEFFSNNAICPSCKQTIDETMKDDTLTKNKCKHDELIEGVSKLNDELQKLNKQIGYVNSLNDQIWSLYQDIGQYESRIKQLESWIKKLEKENNELENIVFDEENSNMVLNQFLSELVTLNETRNGLIDTKRYLDITGTLLKDTGIKTAIIKQYIPTMNNYINKYLSYMDFYVNFTLNENFEETILSRHRDSFAYENFSEGEKLRIDLALLFAWRSIAKAKNSIDTNLLIMDEIIDGAFDQQGVEDFFKLIATFVDTNIFVISPKGDVLLDKFHSNIRFVKKQNFSEIYNG
jgi:DNA repair exonuclease SbcCD ATPase subunit